MAISKFSKQVGQVTGKVNMKKWKVPSEQWKNLKLNWENFKLQDEGERRCSLMRAARIAALVCLCPMLGILAQRRKADPMGIPVFS